MRKIIAFFLSIVMCVTTMVPEAYAADGSSSDLPDPYLKYTENEYMFESIFCSSEGIGYLSMVENIESDSLISSLMDFSSNLIEENLEKKDYAEILANLIAMQEGDFAEQVEQQANYDDLKNLGDYAEDITNLALGAFGGNSVMDEISPIIDAGFGGKDVVIETIEQAKYYQTSIQSYIGTEFFLEAISQYASDKELKSAANSLLKANEALLEKRVEYIADYGETIGQYEADFFIDNLSMALLKSSDLYNTDDTTKWFIDCGSNLLSTVSANLNLGEFVFHGLMLAGDIGFGTSNMFNRYQEMKVVADVANSLIQAIHEEKNADLDEKTKIQEICKYYRALLVTHARGEYLVHQILMNDAGVVSAVRRFSESFLPKEETTDDWYAGQIEVLGEYSDIVNQILFTSEEEVVTANEEPAPDNVGNETITASTIQEGTYEYADGEYLSHFSVDYSSGSPCFNLSFWYQYGQSASIEDFLNVPLVEGQSTYRLQGNRSRQEHEITILPQADGTIWIKVQMLSSGQTWYDNGIWVDGTYSKVGP